MKDEPIYKFDGLKKLLDEKGFLIPEAHPWTPIKGKDVFSNQFDDESLTFVPAPEHGIVFRDEYGYEHVGFLYMRAYKLTEHGKPRMHLCQCETIRSFMNLGRLVAEYRFAETASVMVIDKDHDGKDVEVSELPLCRYCDRMLTGRYLTVTNSREFARITKKQNEKAIQASNEVDIFGFVREWPEISRQFKEQHNYTCAKCGIRFDNIFDQRYLEVHHINGNRKDNSPSNLQCLCIDCHAHTDKFHEKNYSSGAQKIVLSEYREKFK